jgi:hypothetical protein
MKSTSPITIQPKHSDQEKACGARRLHLPLTDYSFQPTASELHTASAGRRMPRPAVGPAFRDLSDQFLGAETKRSYAVEAAFFAIIVVVSAWPIASMVHALSQLLR